MEELENGDSHLFQVNSVTSPPFPPPDTAGKPRAALSVREDGPVLSLYDEKGEVIWSAP